MMPQSAVSTAAVPSDVRVVRELGRVTARAIRGKNRVRIALRSLGALVGLLGMDFTSEAERARRDSLDELCIRAEKLGANGIVGLRFRAGERADGTTLVIASGRAVFLDPPPIEDEPSQAGMVSA